MRERNISLQLVDCYKDVMVRHAQAVRNYSASASVSRRAFGRRGVAPAPRFLLCVRWAGACCARSGCRAGLSAPGAMVAHGVVSSVAACIVP